MTRSDGDQRKTALITGASSGIGKELAILFAAEGHDLVLVARQASRLEEIARELEGRHGIQATVIAKDLSVSTAAPEIHSEVKRRGIEIDVLVNNAGFNVYGRFLETDLASEMRMIQVNLVSLTQLTKLFARDMRERGSGGILNIGSTGSFAPGPQDSVYCATKAYVLSFSEAIAEELRGSGVSVTTLCPGPTDTEFATRAGMTETRLFRGRTMSAKEVALIGYQALRRGQTTVVAGAGNKLQVWSMRMAPRSLVARVGKRLLGRDDSHPEA